MVSKRQCLRAFPAPFSAKCETFGNTRDFRLTRLIKKPTHFVITETCARRTSPLSWPANAGHPDDKALSLKQLSQTISRQHPGWQLGGPHLRSMTCVGLACRRNLQRRAARRNVRLRPTRRRPTANRPSNTCCASCAIRKRRRRAATRWRRASHPTCSASRRRRRSAATAMRV